MQLKTKLQYCWCQHIIPNDDLRCCWTPSQLSEHDYIQIVAVDAQVGLNCDKRMHFVVCWGINGDVRN